MRRRCISVGTHLAIQAIYQPARRVHKLPDHLRQFFRALRLAVDLGRGHGGGVVWWGRGLLLERLCRVDQRDLASCLEDCAGSAIESDGRFDAGLFGQAVEGLFEGVDATGLLRGAGSVMRQ